jgi:hypothetical protein
MLRTATVVPCLFAILSGSLILAADDAGSTEIHFANDVVPILSRYGCNTSGCHGKAEGQNGFKLSVFGFDPGADYAALTQESRGRRVLPSIPDKSLLLLKASGGMPHGGGVRILKGTNIDCCVSGLCPECPSVATTPRKWFRFE